MKKNNHSPQNKNTHKNSKGVLFLTNKTGGTGSEDTQTSATKVKSATYCTKGEISEAPADTNSHLRKQGETSAVGNDVSNGVLDKQGETCPDNKIKELVIARIKKMPSYMRLSIG